MKRLLAVIVFFGTMRGMGQAVGFDSAGIVGGPLKAISRQFLFTEGAAVDRKGNVFFTDQPNNKIWEYTLDGQLVLFMDSAGRANGMYFDPKGRLVACADQEDQLWSIDAKKQVKVLVRDFGGRKFNGPNDLWIDGKGGIFFSDPYYQRDYWTRTKPDLDGEKVYYLAPGASEAMVAAEDFKRPNGIVGTPDGHYLYVSDLNAGKTYKYKIGEGGVLSDRVLFCSQGSDGMTLDVLGNLYLTGNGVTVYSAEGKMIARIPVPEKWTGNLCFGGKDRKTLFITASTGLYSIPMKVKGVE
ncbi:MAG TPA: SMP-30/gluconolactonase/LRE family protein [Puia sp.]